MSTEPLFLAECAALWKSVESYRVPRDEKTPPKNVSSWPVDGNGSPIDDEFHTAIG